MKLAAIVGPTAVGKTALSIAVAQQLNAEIISCDSMQIYKGMDIGTAKASTAELQQVPHHMLDLLAPDEAFTVADYQRLVKELIRDINERGKLPLLVGGTGLYYQAVVDDYPFFPNESQDIVRKKWENICWEEGIAFVYGKLQQVDPEYALKVGPNDRKRIIRAMEVWDLTGEPFTNLQRRNENAYDLRVVGLYVDRPLLYKRIEERVDKMLQDGLVDEVVSLRRKGYGISLNAMNALGYKQVNYYLEGMLTWNDMVAEIKRETRRFAKRQLTWFNKDQRIVWVDVADSHNLELLVKKIRLVLEGHNQQ